MLKVNDLHVDYGAIHALKGVSFAIERGELVTLLGANGAGKTTTLKTLSGLLRPRHGSVELDGEALGQLEAHDIVHRGVAHVPEGRKVFPRFTVLENLRIGAYARAEGALGPELEFVCEMFPRLKERQKQYAGTLSGGEQQMLAIARVMMAGAKLILMDEPTQGLAPAFIRHIRDMVGELKRLGVTVLLVEQNARVALSVCDRGYIMEKGSIVFEASSRELRESPVTREKLGV